MSRILSLDAGLVGCGWVVCEVGPLEPIAAGCLRTAPGTRRTAIRVADDDARRVADLFRGLLAVAREHGVAGIIAELPTGGARGARAARCMGLSTALVACLAEALELPAEWVTPRDVRQAARGATDKRAVQRYALARWPRLANLAAARPAAEWEHIADAAAAAAAAEHGRLVRTLAARLTVREPGDPPQVEPPMPRLGRHTAHTAHSDVAPVVTTLPTARADPGALRRPGCRRAAE
jgi:hypothetical protein